MKLKKNSPKLYFPFIFPSDEGIDWAETSREIFRSSKYIQESYKNTLIEENIKFEDKDLEDLFVIGFKKPHCTKHYAQNGFDTAIIKGNPIVLLFEGLTPSDMDLLKETTGMGKLSKSMDEHSLKEIRQMIKAVFEAKLHSVEYPESVNLEDRFSKEEIIEAVLDGAEFEDLNLFAQFIKSMVEGFITKKRL